jgi:hypothetical protein
MKSIEQNLAVNLKKYVKKPKKLHRIWNINDGKFLKPDSESVFWRGIAAGTGLRCKLNTHL